MIARHEATGAHSRRQGSGTVPLSYNLHTHSARFNGKLDPRCVRDPPFINIRFLFWTIIEIREILHIDFLIPITSVVQR